MNTALPRPLMLLVALCQGILLFLLYRAVDLKHWPAGELAWLFALAAFLVAVPVFFLLLVEPGALRKNLLCLLPFALAVTAASAYMGWQLEPDEFIGMRSAVSFVLIPTLGIAAFKALLYAQAYSADGAISYPALFHYSWRNFLTLGLSLLFVLLFIGILRLWGALFATIGIHFFDRLFEQQWFLFPAATVALAFAVIIFRNLDLIIDSIANILKALIKFLLPLLSVLSLSFLLALPFTGLEPLWDTRLGSGLLLWLQALSLFSVNAVYQGDSRGRPYPALVHRIIYVGVAVLPVYSIIAFHGLFARIDQYGLTVQRCWAVLTAGLLFLFTLGYLWGIVRRQDAWLDALARVNIRLGAVVMTVMLLVNTPVLNFQGLAAQNQLARVHGGDIAATALDLDYFRASLGRQGYLALQQVKTDYGAADPRLAARIDALYATPALPGDTLTLDRFREELVIWPEGGRVPEAVMTALLEQARRMTPRLPTELRFFVVLVDLDDDGTDEIVFLPESQGFVMPAMLWRQVNASWETRMLTAASAPGSVDIAASLRQNQVEVLEARWRELRIGGIRLSVAPENAPPALSMPR
ncbi:MAG: DUF4153 domain-containing protein [Pseudomonadales bacterium]|nr:DUF4153 domain-containing protein [Pseudomonadales bacterium]